MMPLRDIIDSDTTNYRACVWLTEAIKKQVANEIHTILLALTLGREILYTEGDWEQPGFPYAYHNKVRLSIDEWNVFAETIEEAECKMIGMILRGGIGYPLYRRCK